MKKTAGTKGTFPGSWPSGHDQSFTSSLTLEAKIISCPDPPDPPEVREAAVATIFDAMAWEEELIWQAIRILVDEFGAGPAEVAEALESCLRRLETSGTAYTPQVFKP